MNKQPIELKELLYALKSCYMTASDYATQLGVSRQHIYQELKRHGFKNLKELRRYHELS